MRMLGYFPNLLISIDVAKFINQTLSDNSDMRPLKINDMDNKKYIRELFEVVTTTDILIINKDNQLIRLIVPFTVLVVREVPGLVPGEIASVTALRMDDRLIDIYIVHKKAYYYYNFVLFTVDIYPNTHSMPGYTKL